MSNYYETNNRSTTFFCTAGGTLFSLLYSISAAEIIKTSVLAAVGAGVSFCVTMLFKYVERKMRRREES